MNDFEQKNYFVSVDGVSKRYNNFLALDDISFQIERGENFGYIGPNGAGKTTTIKIMVGLLSDFSGTVRIGDFNMPEDRNKVHKLIGYLPQNVSFQEWRTVEHTLRSFGKLSGMDEELDRRIDEVLELIGLGKERNRRIGELSGGTTQRVGLAQALLHDPEFLILDEPLTGLDPANRFEVKQIIRKLSEGGTTVLFSSHILSDVQEIATKIGIIDLGKIIKVGSFEQLKSQLVKTNRIRVELSKHSDKCKEVESIEGVKEIEYATPEIVFVYLESDVDLDEVSQRVLQKMMDLNCRIHSFSPVVPDLDEVYLSYVESERE